MLTLLNRNSSLYFSPGSFDFLFLATEYRLFCIQSRVFSLMQGQIDVLVGHQLQYFVVCSNGTLGGQHRQSDVTQELAFAMLTV